MNSPKAFLIGVLFLIASVAIFAMGYNQGQHNLYVRQCVQEGGTLFEGELPCIFEGRVNNEIVKRMNMMCDDPRKAYNVEAPFYWRHYCE